MHTLFFMLYIARTHTHTHTLGGTWHAWLSVFGVDASSRIHAPAPFIASILASPNVLFAREQIGSSIPMAYAIPDTSPWATKQNCMPPGVYNILASTTEFTIREQVCSVCHWPAVSAITVN